MLFVRALRAPKSPTDHLPQGLPPPLLMGQDPSSAQPGAISPCPTDDTGLSWPVPVPCCS